MDPNTLIQLEASITGLISRILQQATVGSIPLASETESGLVRLVNNLTSTHTDRALTAAQGKVLKDLLDEVTLIISSNDATLDTLQKVVNYIKVNRTSIETLDSTVDAIEAELLNVVRTNDARLTDAREWTASTISQAEAEAGIDTTRRAFTAQRVRQSVAAYTQPFTTADRTKLDGIADGAQVNAVTSVAGRTGAVVLTKADVGLNNVDNTADVNKAVLSAQTASLVNGTDGQLTMRDIRTLSPSSISSGRVQFGFTSWNNNSDVPYADFMLMRGYNDGTGGADNLVLFSKTGIGMRIYQQTFGSTSAFAAYKDVAFTDGTNSTGTWSISTTGNAATATALQTARTINGVSFNGTANITVTANTSNTLTRGTGLTGNNCNGSEAPTWAVAYGTTAGTACQGNDSRLTTNLSYTAAATTGTVTSSTGTNATLPAATTTNAGLLTGADKSKLDGIAAGAQVNVPTNLSYTSSATTGTVVSSTGNNAVIAAATATVAGLTKLIDNLTTNDGTSALTAAQGRALKLLIDGLGISNIANLQTELNGKVSTTGTKSISGLTTINHNVLNIGNSTQSNYIAFRGTAGDDQTQFTHTFIGERKWDEAESSELILFKGNDAETVSGPDRIRLIAPQFVIDSYNSSTLGGTLDDVATSPNLNRILTLRQNGNLGLGTDNPVAKLDIHINVPAPTALVSPVIQLTNKSDGGCSIDFANSSGGKSRLAFGIDSIGQGTDESNFAFSTCVNSGPLQERLRITSGGNVGIGTDTPQYKLEVAGSFAATTKSFLIDHPTKPNMKLRYGSLEGPENGVYVRGRLRTDINIGVIELPDYWIGLVDPESITVQLTPRGGWQELYVSDENIFEITVSNNRNEPICCDYVVFAERRDVAKLQVELPNGGQV